MVRFSRSMNDVFNVDESSELGASPMPEPPKLRIRDRTTQQVSPMLVSQIGDSGGAG